MNIEKLKPRSGLRKDLKGTLAGVVALLTMTCFCVCTALGAAPPQSPKMESVCEIKPHPLIKVKELEYHFGVILEGQETEHEFTIENTGTADLKIANVRVDCGCTAVKYDATIPPGGKGKLRMKVSLKNYVGKVDKKATIQSNDPQSPEVVVRMVGTVTPLIDVKPSTGILFRGMVDQISESVLDLTAISAPFHITGSDTDIADKVQYAVETVSDGKQYRLKVSNKLKQGNYGGFIKLNTDFAQKPTIIIRVSGFIEGEISVKPKNILIGKLSANQPERLGRVAVTSNRNKPFDITELTYDEGLMSISREPSEDQAGFVLVVKPKLEGLAVGARKQSKLTIETDLSPKEKMEVLVHIFNAADQPEARPK